jgi:hypothetical protein
MNRDVLLVYLKNIRDLEVAGYQLRLDKNRTEAKYRCEISALNKKISEETTSNYRNKPDVPIGQFIFSGFLLSFALLVFIGLRHDINRYPFETLFCYLVSISSLVLAAVLFPWSYFEEKEKSNDHNEAEKKRLEQCAALVPQQKQTIQTKLNALSTYTNGCTAELRNIGNLLQNAYSLNILPSQHRNLASVYYIYDYMSTSQASLRDTLLHEHMENGIQRILNRLDAIMAQNEQHILLERRMEAHSRETAESTQRMLSKQQQILESMERTEQNTLEAAQAARIAAQYGEINTFFSAATYLERQR